MDASKVIEVIKCRQAKYRQRPRSGSSPYSNEDDRIDLAIAEEYDSLMAELETLGARPVRAEAGREMASNAAATSNHESGSRIDDFVLGDQGQSGG